MKKLSERELMVTLIKDDLINYRLVEGLNQLGLINEAYHIHVSDTIFKLMRIKEVIGQEVEYAQYLEWREPVMRLDLQRDYGKLKKMAEEIYSRLSAVREKQRKS